MSAWSDEYAPPNLVTLGSQVRSAFGLAANAIGIKGDDSHDYGYHRSRRWINEAGQGGGDYSNQLVLDTSGGDSNWLAALDVSLDPARMKQTTGRLINAMKAKDPRVAQVREVFGTLDGVSVAGWDAATGKPTSADSSHLWHLHISFYRSRANYDHSGVLQVLTGGGSMSDYTPLGPPESVKINGVVRGDSVLLADLWGQELSGTSPYAANSPSRRTAQLNRIEETVKKISTGGIDVEALAAALAPFIQQVVQEELSSLVLVNADQIPVQKQT